MASDAPPQLVITVTLPLPPNDLSKNGRCHWRKKARLYQQHRAVGQVIVGNALQLADRDPDPTSHYRLGIHWRYRLGPQPDDDNVTERCAAYRDGAADAGLVADDAQITTGAVTFERVGKGDEGVVLTFRMKGATDA